MSMYGLCQSISAHTPAGISTAKTCVEDETIDVRGLRDVSRGEGGGTVKKG